MACVQGERRRKETFRHNRTVAASFAILRAVFRATRRSLGTFGSITVNNFFLFVALLVYGALVSGVMPVGAYPFLALLAVVVILPLTSGPLSRIPRSRLALWPVGRVPALFFGGITAAARGLVAAPWIPLRFVPPGPGRLGQLIRANLRQMATVLDTWVALLLSLGAAVWRITAREPDPAAIPVLSILVALALSTYAQCLFGLDSRSGLTRYRLLPVHGWEILLAKDAAYLAVLVILLLPLDIPTGITFGLVSLAVGRYPAVRERLVVDRWRFTGGRVRFGVLQCVLGIALAAGERSYGPILLLAAALLYAASYWKHDSVMRQ